jgi:glucose-1-phosphate cytidylyltransferase
LHENGGYLVLRQAVFNHLGRGRDLDDAFNALAPSGRVLAFKHDGFWMPADTFKERAVLDEMYESGNAPWARSLAMVS